MNELLKYFKDLKILYVEDDECLAKEMKEMFSHFIDNIQVAYNGEEALKIYKKDNFDIVISDIKMPKMSGIELAKEIKNITSDQEIIIISAYNDSNKLMSLIKIGISDFILKPLDFQQFLQTMLKVSKNIYNKKITEQFLIQQSKLAQMGEMIDMIAHQWLQFLNVLNMRIEILKMENDENTLDSSKINNYTKELLLDINELVNTLNEFRNFFKNKSKEKILLNKIIDSVLILLKDYLTKNNIMLNVEIDDIVLEIYPNEFKQVILNIINNMVDAFNERKISNRMIKIYNDKHTLYIEDNAGGIKEDIIDKIFDDNFTTKKTGTGKGLYMSKLIMNKLNGDIFVENTQNGARFIIKVKNGR